MKQHLTLLLNRSNGVYLATEGSLQGNMNTFFYRSGGNWLPNGVLRPEARSLTNPKTPLLYPNWLVSQQALFAPVLWLKSSMD